MKVKIKKEGKEEIYNLINSWDDVNLTTWIKLIEVETKSQSEEAEETIAALSDIPRDLIKSLALKDVAIILSKLSDLQAGQTVELKRIMRIDGVDYGFHPNLDDITLGEYADIESFIKEGLEENMPQIMAVLFRPVVKKKKNAYTIEAYNGDLTERAEAMRKMSASQVQGALVFFWNLGNELSLSMESFLMEQTQEAVTTLQTETLQKDGATLD